MARDQRSRAPREKEEKQYDERVLAIDRVARVVKGGRRFRFRALVVVGDGKGKVGVGTAKGQDVTAAISKATDIAKRKVSVVAVENGTIPHEQQSKVSGAVILIKPAAPGTGLKAGGVVRVVLEVAGVHNILSKSIGSNNKTNIAYATIKALNAIKSKDKWHKHTGSKAPKTAAKNEAKAEAKVAKETK